MWAILDIWQNVDIVVAIFDFETLMSFMHGFENYIIVIPKFWGIIFKKWLAPPDSSKK